ncbi:MAG TPA: HPr family phosphocarrier protein [Lachnospiraceae bacterium]|nr:HPr family phosphocarrier protein [Lachnospiraceae bacterium]
MKKLTIRLKDINDVKDFVTKASPFPFDVDLLTGRYIIDGKSIMGVLSLDLSRPLSLVIHSEHCDDFLKAIEPYILTETEESEK